MLDFFVGLTIKISLNSLLSSIKFNIEICWLALPYYSQTTSKLKCVGSPCRIIYSVFGKPPVSLLKLFDYIYTVASKTLCFTLNLIDYVSSISVLLQLRMLCTSPHLVRVQPETKKPFRLPERVLSQIKQQITALNRL